MNVGTPAVLAHSWLLLVHQLPAKPAYHRPGSPLQIRLRQRLPREGGRAAFRHVRGGVHARGRQMHLRGAARSCGLKDAALRAIAEIIHDIDLKDGKFGRTEVAGIRTLMEGIGAATKDDAQRIARGTEVFNDLYEYFRKRRR